MYLFITNEIVQLLLTCLHLIDIFKNRLLATSCKPQRRAVLKGGVLGHIWKTIYRYFGQYYILHTIITKN